MDCLGYIHSIKPSPLQFSLSRKLLVTLYYFAKKRPSSAWDVFKAASSNDDDRAAYKNVLTKVKKLSLLHLIQRERKTLQFHGSIYYKLTPRGIFQILSNSDIFGTHVLTDLIKNYGNDEIFKTFIYPYFEIETLEELRSDSIGKEILDFYISICKAIEWRIERINDFRHHKRIIYSVGFWNEIAFTSSETGIVREQEVFVTGLKVNLGINWLDGDIKFELIGTNTLKISKGINYLILELNEKNGTVSVSEDGSEIIRFEIQPMLDDLHIVYFTPVTEASL